MSKYIPFNPTLQEQKNLSDGARELFGVDDVWRCSIEQTTDDEVSLKFRILPDDWWVVLSHDEILDLVENPGEDAVYERVEITLDQYYGNMAFGYSPLLGGILVYKLLDAES